MTATQVQFNEFHLANMNILFNVVECNMYQLQKSVKFGLDHHAPASYFLGGDANMDLSRYSKALIVGA